MTKKKGKIILLASLVIAVAILSYQAIQRSQEKTEQWARFVNHFYFAIDRSIQGLDYLLENEPEGDALNDALHRLERDLLQGDTILSSGKSYLNTDIYYSHFFREATYFLYGIRMTGDVFAKVPPMGEDGRLDELEIAILSTLKNRLVDAKQQMYSEERRQEKTDLTLQDVNDVILTYLIDDIPDIYRKSLMSQ